MYWSDRVTHPSPPLVDNLGRTRCSHLYRPIFLGSNCVKKSDSKNPQVFVFGGMTRSWQMSRPTHVLVHEPLHERLILTGSTHSSPIPSVKTVNGFSIKQFHLSSSSNQINLRRRNIVLTSVELTAHEYYSESTLFPNKSRLVNRTYDRHKNVKRYIYVPILQETFERNAATIRIGFSF